MAEDGAIEAHAVRHQLVSNECRTPIRFIFHGGERSTRSPLREEPAAFETVPARLSGSLSMAEH